MKYGLLLAVGLVGWSCGGAPPPPPAPAKPAPTRKIVEDSEPDDGLQVASDKGHLNPAVVDAALAPHRAAFSQCYTQRVGRRSWLGGHVVLHWDVAADGAASVWIAESDLGAWPIEQCLLDVARDVSLGTPIGGPAELTLPLDLSTARTLPLSDDPPSGKPITELHSKLDACAKAGSPGAPKAGIAMPDDVTLTIYVNAHGHAESAGFASPAAAIDDAWATCAEKAALAWRLPEPKPAEPKPPGPKPPITKLAIRYRPRS